MLLIKILTVIIFVLYVYRFVTGVCLRRENDKYVEIALNIICIIILIILLIIK